MWVRAYMLCVLGVGVCCVWVCVYVHACVHYFISTLCRCVFEHNQCIIRVCLPCSNNLHKLCSIFGGEGSRQRNVVEDIAF